MPTAPLRLRSLFAVLAAAALCRPALADDGAAKRACIQAAEEGQTLRLQRRVVAARDAFASCASDACPAVVRTDCRQWLTEVVASLPTVVVVARSSSGRDLFDVSVTVDGAVVVPSLDGQEVAVDAGEHTFEFRHAGAAAVRQAVVIRAAEKHRVLAVTFVDPKPPAPPPPAAPAISPLAWALFGASGAAIGTAIALGATGLADANHLSSTCKPACDPATVSPVRTRLVVADVLAGAGVVAAGAGLWIVLAAPRRATAALAPSPVAAGFVPSPSFTGLSARLAATF